MLSNYYEMKHEREQQGIYPKPLTVSDTEEVIGKLQHADTGSETLAELKQLLSERVPPGVDEAAQVKAEFLHKLAIGELNTQAISPKEAIRLLGTMQGGYNIAPLVSLLTHPEFSRDAVDALKHAILVFDALENVSQLAKENCSAAQDVLKNWADGVWFTDRPDVAEKITVTVFKVPGEINTDDLSPAQDAWSRPDIPLHAEAMLKMPREGMVDAPLAKIQQLKENGYPVAFVGDVVGTGSSRKSAANSLIWHIGQDIPYVPNKRFGGVVLGSTIAPIFYNTLEDAGALPVETDVTQLETGQVIDIYPYKGEVRDNASGELLSQFELKSPMLLDSVRAGGRIPLILGRQLTDDSRTILALDQSKLFVRPEKITKDAGFTLAQKIVGKACGVDGVYPGQYCQPKVTSVGSQDTTGPMTRDEIKDLACLNFNADLVLQTFCHTAPYPRPIDAENHATMPTFFEQRGGVAIKPGDGIIHSWLNRMILPDTVGTGGDSHTRFPMGISFPAGSGLVAFAAATGMMPLDMPESVLVRFKGTMKDGITLRDLVHAIPYFAQQAGLLTVEKSNKKNIFAGKVVEIEGLSELSVEQAFELADATAERSAAGCTIELGQQSIATYLKSNITLLNWMISQGYESKACLEKRVQEMENWLADPTLLKADKDAGYAAVLEIDIDAITEPLLCCPNDPDDVKPLSAVANTAIDEVFIGSCMTNIGHFRAAAKILEPWDGANQSKTWIAPPTKMDEKQLMSEGIYNIFARRGVRTEMPGCSLCMGNQAQVAENATVISTSTRNFPNRLGKGSQVYLGSAELATVTAMLGRLPSVEEYVQHIQPLKGSEDKIYQYLNFDQLESYQAPSELVIRQVG
ncbi:bifunctional aconitate hydratase 2/2-methylisocitrate dehydratase [Vibrio sp. HA2012]|uniref:bifunctional aconitate hydratase 2/2-methylisocitrate dehydratase n=1 Tax=Vibrio sp. HA2012 TaxID=1971595 RepID=UPI000C2BCA0C|nr:bifunctional aconitate hydratase 2/2-methylisocitrate dehydratase [Vibrio sp. HA2012]PJC87576.1 bifunctional aconitate hydratase 2/2-methylisocitrate dehydratase [Vibrio sp. HA2012]